MKTVREVKLRLLLKGIISWNYIFFSIEKRSIIKKVSRPLFFPFIDAFRKCKKLVKDTKLILDTLWWEADHPQFKDGLHAMHGFKPQPQPPCGGSFSRSLRRHTFLDLQRYKIKIRNGCYCVVAKITILLPAYGASYRMNRQGCVCFL